MNVLLIGGGSIGHIAPLVAVWRAVQQVSPGAQARVLCADRKEEIGFCRAEGLEAIGVPKLRLSLGAPFAFFKGYRTAVRVIDEFHPDAVFCKGGSVSIPACLAAKHAKIPVILHESDAVMGRANQLLCKWATIVCCGMPMSYVPCPTSHALVTGNPIRPEVLHGSKSEGLRLTGFSGTRPILLILGGSQGAQAVNQAVIDQLDQLTTRCDVIHITGAGKAGATPNEHYRPFAFVQKELPHLYAVTTLAVTRAGAGSLSELAACRIPSIVIPIEGLAQDHQVHNAKAAGGLLLRQRDIGSLSGHVTTLLDVPEKRAACIPAGPPEDAARRIAEILVQCVASQPRSA